MNITLSAEDIDAIASAVVARMPKASAKNSEDPLCVDTKTACKLLGNISRYTLFDLATRGKLRPVKDIRGLTLWPISQLKSFAEGKPISAQ
jgi:hypothetical protein